jgi:hypothetical protein
MPLISTQTFQPKPSPKGAILYSKEALRQDLERVRNAWEDCQATRDRDAIYGYLTAVYALVAWWTAEGRDVERARRALRLQRLEVSKREDPFGAVIRCTADPAKADKRTRSKWSRVMRTRQATNRIPSRSISSSSARAASTRARLGSPSGDRRGRSTPETGRRGRRPASPLWARIGLTHRSMLARKTVTSLGHNLPQEAPRALPQPSSTSSKVIGARGSAMSRFTDCTSASRGQDSESEAVRIDLGTLPCLMTHIVLMNAKTPCSRNSHLTREGTFTLPELTTMRHRDCFGRHWLQAVLRLSLVSFHPYPLQSKNGSWA